MKKDKEDHYRVIKRPIYQGDVKIENPHIFAFNFEAPKYIK